MQVSVVRPFVALEPAPVIPAHAGIQSCAWHDAQAAVPGIAWDNMVHRYRTEEQRQQGKGITSNGMSEGSMR